MHYLGVEIGGTKLQLGIGPGDGTLAALWRGPVDPAAGADGIRRQIMAAVPELLAKSGVARSDLRSVGIGFGGPVNDATASVIKSHQIAGWDNFPLANWIGELVGLPAALGNDADCAGLGEALFGAGKGLSPIFYITIGSGIGGGLIINGDIYRGSGKGAAEIGHLRLVNPHDPHHPDADILEHWSSGWGIAKQAEMDAVHLPGSSPWARLARSGEGAITATAIAAAASQGDAFAVAVLDRSWNMLAEAICQVIALLSPRRVVIGGGVSLMGEQLLFAPLRAKVAERVFRPFADCYDIMPAALGEEVVVHGALALARRRLAAR
jgi:glucokinase